MVIKRLASVRNSADLDSARPSNCSVQIQAAASPLLLSADSQTTPLDFDQNCKNDKRFSMSTRKLQIHVQFLHQKVATERHRVYKSPH
jgi:hypothetical protein